MEVNKENNSNKLCDICGNIPTSLCFNCNMYLCDSCFKFIHDKKINQNHKKEKIDYFVPIDLKCPDHPKDRISLFCIDEKGKFIINIFIFILYRILLF